MPTAELPEFRDWSIAAVRLLQGVVYADEPRIWEIVMSSQAQLLGHFARIGLLLVVDEPEGLAYLRQLGDDEMPAGYEKLPRLFRRTKLGYEETLLCVLLREVLRRFEEEDLHEERAVVELSALLERWRILTPAQHDDVRAQRELTAALGKLEDLGFVRRIAEEPPTWEVRRILKARLPVAELEDLKRRMLAASDRRATSTAEESEHE
jgi:Domain of unknown function (DUF4194)